MEQSTVPQNGSRLKILEVIDNYYPTIDGVVRVVDNYAKNLNRRARCVVLAPRYPDAPAPDGYELVTCFSVSGGRFGVRLPLPQFDISLKKYLDKENFDIIHCHSPVTLASYIAKYAKKRRIPLVFTIHTKFHEEINSHVKSKFLQKFALNYIVSNMKKMDYYWAVSEISRDVLIKDYGIKADCRIMPNGADLSADMASADKVGEIRQNCGVKDGEFTMLAVGRLTKVKNYGMLLSAVKLLREKNLPVKLIVVGFGDCEKQLKEQAAAENSGGVIFAGKITDRTLLASYYSACDLFVLPSTFDTSSLATKDSYAMSVPALLVKGSAAAEGIIDGHNGFLAENSASAFSEKTEFILKNRDILENAKINCNKELFVPWERLMDNVLREYEKIVEDYKMR
jgi:glycosyltransferase involved in cell wall biosynthesis